MRVAVVGGGISGLATAFRLKSAGVDVTVFESGSAAGGNIRTENKDGFLFESGPNSFLSSRPLLDLIDDLGISGEIVAPRPEARNRYIVRDGHLVALPSGIGSLIGSRAFSTRGKSRILKEPLVRSRSKDDETVYRFFERRLGREIADYAVDPFVSGIYAGDPKRLSIRSAFPKIYEYEHRYGSLLAGSMFAPRDKSAALPKGSPRSFALRGGSSTLIEALSNELGASLALGSELRRVSQAPAGFSVESGKGEENYHAVVISTPAHIAANLMKGLDEELARQLSEIYYPPIAVVFTGFDADQVGEDPAGFGMLVPALERRRILGTLFNSSAFDGRSPEGTHLFTTFIGGSRNAEYCGRTPDELVRIALDELRPMLKIAGEPVVTAVKKWDRSIPQYNVGYDQVISAIDRFTVHYPGIFFCSNFYKGISVGDCVKNSETTVRKVLEFVNG